MATAVAGDVFTNWINCKLRELNADESVFSAYIIAILESDETLDEKKEALEEILSQIIETEINSTIKEITDKWESTRPQSEEPKKDFEDVDTKLAKLLERKCVATTVQKQQYTPDELRIREQILAQYSQVELEECDDDDESGVCGNGEASGSSNKGGTGAGGTASQANNVEKKSDPLLIKNTNAQDVAQAAKERREQAKLESKAKKDKDKEDREKQKQLREEKKEKRKTVKGERRR